MGPDFVGLTTLLRRLEHAGYSTLALATKPPSHARASFAPTYFHDLVAAWQALPRAGQAILVEDSPWAYLAKHGASLAPEDRHARYAQLAPLTLPDLTLVFHTSGRQVGLRHPHHHSNPDEHSPAACDQMRALDFLPTPTRHFDATPSPAAICTRVRAVLETRVFDVAQTAFDGLDHLCSTP